jgi:hypothetical protein
MSWGLRALKFAVLGIACGSTGGANSELRILIPGRDELVRKFHPDGAHPDLEPEHDIQAVLRWESGGVRCRPRHRRWKQHGLAGNGTVTVQ